MSPYFALLRASLLAVILASAAPARASGADTWRLDPVHTQIVLFVDHLRLSSGIGRLHIREGWLRFDPDDWSSAQAEVHVDLATLDMGETKWSETVRSAQFLNVSRWPLARFVSTSLEKTGGNTGVLHGDLTLRGITKPVRLEITFNRIGRDPYAFRTKAGFSARATLDRGDFGMNRFADVVGNLVELRIEVEGIRDRTAAEETPDNANQEH